MKYSFWMDTGTVFMWSILYFHGQRFYQLHLHLSYLSSFLACHACSDGCGLLSTVKHPAKGTKRALAIDTYNLPNSNENVILLTPQFDLGICVWG